MENQHPEAWILANDRPSAIGDDLYQWALDAEAMIRRQHARNQELEAFVKEINQYGVLLRAGGPAPHDLKDRSAILEQYVKFNPRILEMDQQPEAIKTASKIELAITCGFIGSAEQYDHLLLSAVSHLRRLHARVEELEAMLDALGAGGVSAQRVMQGKDHIAQPTQMATTTVVLPEPIGTVGAAPGTSGFTLTVFEAARVPVGTNIYTEQQVRELLDKAACTKSQTGAQEPFGYFKAEPFGWRDCAETDEGAIALYEAPQPQADARDAELVAAVVYASTEAMNSSIESPKFDGTIILESHHAARLSLALDELEQHRAAIAAAKKKDKP